MMESLAELPAIVEEEASTHPSGLLTTAVGGVCRQPPQNR